jgi:hypothetical protein
MEHLQMRRSERTPSNGCAVIRTEDASLTVSCIVRNLSEDGAKLLVEEQTPLPPEFILFLRPNSMIGRRCRTIWRIGNKIGVRFVAAYLDKSAPKGSGVWAPE